MKKLVIYINYFGLGALAISIPIVFCFLGFSIEFAYTTILLLLGIAIFEAVMITVREMNDLNKNDAVAKALLTCSVCLAILTTAEYYALKYIGHYTDFGYIYWIVILLILLITVGVYFIAYRKFKKVNNKPKFIVNNRK